MTQEQWMQVFAIVAPIIVSGTGMFITMTWILSARIERGAEGMRTTTKTLALLIPRIDNLAERVSATEARLNNIERQVDWRPSERSTRG